MKRFFTLVICVLFVCFSLLAISHSNAQCSLPPLAETISCSGTATDNANLNPGDVKCVSGDQISNVNLNGGTLIISGTVQVNNININSGNILITSTGVASLPGSNYNGNVNIINYGSLTYRGDVILQNSNNHIYNASVTSTIDMGLSGLNFSSSSSDLVNLGTISLGQLTLNSNNGGICMGNGSKLKIVSLINNRDNMISVPEGTACLSHSGFAQMNNKLSSTANLIICPGSGSSFSNPGGNGGYNLATVNEVGCTECASPVPDKTISPLPVNLAAFWATSVSEGIKLNWRTSSETNNDYFVIERSINAISFEAISEQISGQINSNVSFDYNFTDVKPYSKVNYYRLKQVDTDGSVNYSRIIAASFSDQLAFISVYPNPVTDFVQVNLKNPDPKTSVQINILNQSGVTLSSRSASGDHVTDPISLRNLDNGIYFVKVTSNGQGTIFRIMKN